ncbi:MAG: 30S ribosomal protein S11 [Candidatus Magasanikbacteria bacterium]|jgi:small subunit ribosomal protein S11
MTDVANKTAPAKNDKEAAVKVQKKKAMKQIPRGNAYIQATYNNTIVTITDPNGNALAWSSAGIAGFKGPKKATPYAASMVVKAVVEKIAPYGMKEVSVFVKGIGGGREGAIRAVNTNGLNIVAINEITPIPHNGCRPPKRRRV